MTYDDKKINIIVESLHEFLDNMVKHNINLNEWEDFLTNKKQWYTRLGMNKVDFDIDENGSRWIPFQETTRQGLEWDSYLKHLNKSLDNVVFDWVDNHGDNGWEDFLYFLNEQKDTLIMNVMSYHQFHPIEPEIVVEENVSYDHDTEREEQRIGCVTKSQFLEECKSNESDIDDEELTIEDLIRRIRCDTIEDDSHISIEGDKNGYTD